MYITVTKLADIYETEDPYISMTQMEIGSTNSLPNALKDTPEAEVIIANAESVIEADTAERETLEAHDEIISNTEAGEDIPEPTREEALEELLKMKNQQLMDAGIIPPTIPSDPLAGLPEPSTEAGDHVIPTETSSIDVESQDDLDYAAMTAAPPE